MVSTAAETLLQAPLIHHAGCALHPAGLSFILPGPRTPRSTPGPRVVLFQRVYGCLVLAQLFFVAPCHSLLGVWGALAPQADHADPAIGWRNGLVHMKT